MKKRFASLNRENIQNIFLKLDAYFLKKKKKIQVTTLGGVAILMLGFIERSTYDIDVAVTKDTEVFLNACEELEVEAQAVSIAMTVDFNDAKKQKIFKGKALTIFSVLPKDLIKLKLERFRKQDPEDIYAIIKKTRLSFEEFSQLVKEGVSYFVGRPQEYLLNASVVVEQMWPDCLKKFLK
ncbi:MAG: hypothetical protein HQM15_05270 [Deltaproteobacteria bacterium]|nr:hypothetical protein [Deltaproteobacteria bacterium]